MLGIFIGIIIQCVFGWKKHQSQKTKKVAQGTFHEIDIKPRDHSHTKGDSTVGQAGIASISVADGNSGYPIDDERMEGKKRHGKNKKLDKLNTEHVGGAEYDTAKPKKGRKKPNKMMTVADNHLNIEDDEMNNSWDSNQHMAMKVDLSN